MTSPTDEAATRPGVTVCRGCCCGTEKHPHTDHAGQVHRLARSGARVRVSDCLGVCEHSNVVVMQPSPAERRRGGRPVWLAGILDDDVTHSVAAWAADGGPGSVPPPENLRPHIIDRPDPKRT
jgi:hypothetical protein